MARQNGISVEDMLDLEIMDGCNIVAGFKGIKNTVSRVNVVADPDILDWVQEGEFLLTTAYFFEKDNMEVQKELIKDAYENNLAGIGIKVSPYLDALPDEVLSLAEEMNFPLIDIHHSIPLSDIMLSLIKEIFNKQASLLERIERIHERLMEAMLDGKGIGEIIQVIHENIKNPVLLNLNFSNQIFSQLGDLDAITTEELFNDMKKFYESYDARSKLKRLDEDKILINDKFVNRMIMPIVLKDDVYGHIFTWSTTTPLGGFDLSIIESASTTIALAVLQELSIKEVEIRYRSEFFEDLISVDARRKNKALERAHFFNLSPDDYYVIEVMSFKLKFEEEKDSRYFFEHLKDHVNAAVMVIEDVMNYLNLNGLVSTKLNGIQILLGFKNANNINARLEDFNNRVYKILEDKFSNMDMKIGIGRSYKGLENVNKSFSDAIKAKRTGNVFMDKKIINFNELGIFKILCQDVLIEELGDFYTTTLKPLVDYDNKKSTEFVKTLEAYFEHNGNLTRMSEQLYTHYNTILYRISRIEEITNMELDNPNDRLNLEIALKITQLLFDT